MGNKTSILEHILALDISRDIVEYGASSDLSESKKSERMRDYAAYGIACMHRLLPPYISMLGLEALLLQGKIKEGVIALSTAATGAALDFHIRKIGRTMDRDHAIVDYLAGRDISEYAKVYEPLLRKLTHRGISSKGIDYWIYFRMLLFSRLGPAIIEIHGMTNIIQGNYKIGLIELVVGIYKNVMDYRSMIQRDAWLNFYAQVEASGTMPHLTDNPA